MNLSQKELAILMDALIVKQQSLAQQPGSKAREIQLEELKEKLWLESSRRPG